jgi:6-bladed beta-propeller
MCHFLVAGDTRGMKTRFRFSHVAVLLMIACGDATTARMSDVTIDTLGGVVYVHNPLPATIDTVQSIARIGRAGGLAEPEPDEFGRVTSATLDAANALFVADAQARQVRVFTSTGAFVEAFGRSGAGPGEFGALYSLAWAGDTLLTLDSNNARISAFASDGTFLTSWQWLPLTGPVNFVRFYPAGPHEAYVIGLRQSSVPRATTYVRFTAAGATDTLDVVTPEEAARNVLRCPRSDRAISFFSIPFAGRHLAAPGPNGEVAIAWSSTYRVALVKVNGDTSRVIERAYAATPVTDTLWRAATADYETFRQEWPGSRCEPSSMTRPEFQPALQGLYFDQSGRLVVEVTASNGVRYDFYDEQGRAMFTLAGPERDVDVPPYFRDPYIVQVSKDSLGVQVVNILKRDE